MKAIDIVLPEPRTELELHERWKNRLHTELNTRGFGRYAKKIEIKYIEKISCTGRGRVTCEQQGEHSWFNHSMDKAY